MSVTEFIELSDKEFDRISKRVRETYPNACILWIEKNKNSSLEKEYHKYKAKFEEPNEMELFHGTSESAARSIMDSGFDPLRCRDAWYGNGVYFSPSAQVSLSYSMGITHTVKKTRKDIQYVLLNKVCLGKLLILRNRLQDQDIPFPYTSTKSPTKPAEYVVNKREAVWPEYLISFYPQAK